MPQLCESEKDLTINTAYAAVDGKAFCGAEWAVLEQYPASLQPNKAVRGIFFAG